MPFRLAEGTSYEKTPMFTRQMLLGLVAAAAALATPAAASAADPFADVVEKANKKLVKVFGAGGFQRLNNYGTGIVVSKDGHILTVASQLLDTADLVVVSPGVTADHPALASARARGVPILGELELAYRTMTAEFVAITGNKGKKTTTDLNGAMLDE